MNLTSTGDTSHRRRAPVACISSIMDVWSETPIMTNELYANLSTEVLQQLTNEERSATVPPGSKLIEHEISPNQLIILNSGLAEITVTIAGKPISLGTVGSGNVLGLRSIMCGEVPEIDVTCLEECDITLLQRDTFLEVLRRNPEMYLAVVKVLSADLKRVQSFLRDKTAVRNL